MLPVRSRVEHVSNNGISGTAFTSLISLENCIICSAILSSIHFTLDCRDSHDLGMTGFDTTIFYNLFLD